MSPTIRGLGGKARRSHGEGDAVRVGSVAVMVLRSVVVQWSAEAAVKTTVELSVAGCAPH